MSGRWLRPGERGAKRGSGGAGLPSDGFRDIPDTGYTLILSNPPYHTDFRVAKHFIEKGFNRLAIGGKMVMVTKRRDWYKRKIDCHFRRGTDPGGGWVLRVPLGKALCRLCRQMKARSVTGRDRRKLGGQAKPEKDGYGGLSAQKRNPAKKASLHILLSEHQLVATKGCKALGVLPPRPQKLADFLFMKIGGYGIS